MTAAGTSKRHVVPLVMLAVLLAVAGYLAVATGRQYLADRAFKPIRIPAPAVAPAAATRELAAATGTPAAPSPARPGPMPAPAAVAAALAAGLADPGLGPSVSAQVFDASTGTALVQQRPAAMMSPASTAKLLTAAAVLSRFRATDRYVTRVLAGSAPGSVVLVGGGDPTLSAAPAGQPAEYAEAARISQLAAQVHTALGGRPVSQVVVDGSLFTGAATAPGWAPEDAPSSYACPITAAMVDGGRDTPGAAQRAADPDLAAGAALAAALGAPGATVLRDRAPAGARQLGAVRSAPVGVLVEQMLRDSDDVLAEVLARQVAVAATRPASFAGGAAAISATLAPLGVTVGAGMRDGSGLSVADRIPAGALTQVLLRAVGGHDSRLAAMVSGLSVAGWDGTLVEQGRFTGSNSHADGVVRAKTGSLTGVSGLAGLVTDADGRLLVFAFLADQSPSEAVTRTAIDSLTARLASCGCH